MTRIYLDYAATAPLRASARAAMLPWLGDVAVNPSSVHTEGRRARRALDAARDIFATAFGLRPREIFFTASGSESVTLALLGTLRALGPRGYIITSPTEHAAVLAAAAEMSELGWEHVVLPVDGNGAIDPERLAHALDTTAAGVPQLVSLMLVNNELGTINDVAAAVRCAHARGAVVHCDAIGAGALVPIVSPGAEIDLVSLAAHKFGGPTGVGILAARQGIGFASTVFGGGQEFGKRAGTENVAAICGAAAAFCEVEAQRANDAPRIAALRDLFEARVCAALPDIYVHACDVARAPGMTNIAVPDLDNDILPAALDLAGVAASAGSACAAGALKRSHVLAAIGYCKGASIRLSWGAASTRDETLDAAERFIAITERARQANGHRR